MSKASIDTEERMADAPKGRFTFRFAAVCFGLSAVWELLSLQGQALLFGNVVGGVVAWVYHIVYVALFAWLAFGLWVGSRSALYVLFTTAVFYTVDRLQLLLVGDVLASQIRQQLAGNEQLLQIVSVDYLLQVLTLTVITIVLCWWGFVAYAYYRRAYFGIGRTPHDG
jgi:hypothetical protein